MVKKKDSQLIFAMKVISKKILVKQKKVTNILCARNMLVRTAVLGSPFVISLKFSFQTLEDLYLVTEYMAGGELLWYLQEEGRFSQDCAKFYIAEIILALQHLHQHNIVFGDLRPEKILFDEDGHIALCDFGQSEAGLNPQEVTLREPNEYTAPELLLEEIHYTKMVDFWSLGVLSFEMICGWSPFYAEDNEEIRKNITSGRVRFPRDSLDLEGRNFIKGLLHSNPLSRLGSITGAEDLKSHPFLANCDWVSLSKKKADPPLKPRIISEQSRRNSNKESLTAVINDDGNSTPGWPMPDLQSWRIRNNESLRAVRNDDGNSMPGWSLPLSPSMQANFKGFTFVDETNLDEHFKVVDRNV